MNKLGFGKGDGPGLTINPVITQKKKKTDNEAAINIQNVVRTKLAKNKLKRLINQAAEFEPKNEELESLPISSPKRTDEIMSKIEALFMGASSMTMNSMMRNKTKEIFIEMTKGTDIDLSGVTTRNQIQRIIDDIRKPQNK